MKDLEKMIVQKEHLRLLTQTANDNLSLGWTQDEIALASRYLDQLNASGVLANWFKGLSNLRPAAETLRGFS